jgi:hypothetical protein
MNDRATIIAADPPRTLSRVPEGQAMRRHITKPGWSVALSGLALAGLILARPALEARQGGGQLVPVAASSLVRNAKAYLGANVSLMATVEALLSKTAFAVDQDRSRTLDETVLVIAPTLNEAPDLNAYVTIIGTVVAFDPADLAARVKGYALDLPPEAIEKYRGRPAVIARAVLDSEMVDLAKVPIAPLTPEEAALDQAMKEISAAFPALRGAIDTANQDIAEENVVILREYFGQAETFFKAREAADAMTWVQEARTLVQSIGEAAAASKWDSAGESAGRLQQLCQQCHGARRQRMDDGSYRFRADR